MLSINELEQKAKEYNSLKSTKEQLKWFKKNQNIAKLYLDNDMTFPAFIDESGEAYDLDDFPNLELKELYEYIGNTEGVKILLSIAGITHFEDV